MISQTTMNETYDFVVIGAGPTGLMFSACMSRLGNYKIKHIDQRREPTRVGRADGIQPRTLDILRNMGLKRQIMAENPGKIYVTAFWGPSRKSKDSIERKSTYRSFPESIDTRHPFSTILHQGRIESMFLEDLKQRELVVDRPWSIRAIHYDGNDPLYPIEVQLAHVDGTDNSTIRAKYLLGADGARSMVREMLGIKMNERPSTGQVWSVIDGVVRTNFPDIQIKCTVHSKNGSAMIIPQGRDKVRIYVQIFPQPGMQVRHGASTTVSQIQEGAQQVFQPYYLEWESIDWHSAYHIGQAVAENYSLDERVFIAGDACHTHSPKSGQGMNYGIQDVHNLSWKLHLVESGFLQRSALQTYEEERKLVANALIDFDAGYAGLFGRSDLTNVPGQRALEAQSIEFMKRHISNLTLTSGYGICYPKSFLSWSPNHSASSKTFMPTQPKTDLASGSVFPQATVTRVIDAQVTYLEQEFPFSGSFLVYIFAGDPLRTRQAIEDLAQGLQERSIFSRFQRPTIDTSFIRRHNPHSPFFSFSIIFNAPRETIDLSVDLPDFFSYYKHHVYVDERLYGKYAAEQGSVHMKMGLDLQLGGLAVVRPDGYVGCTLDLAEGMETSQQLRHYFERLVGSNHAEILSVAEAQS